MKFLETKAINALAAGLVVAASPLFGGNARAGADTWTGATSARWGDSNWTGANNPPASGDSLIFSSATGVGGTALNDNLTSTAFSLAGITFYSGAAAFTVSGNPFILEGGITNNSNASLETINDQFSVTGSQTLTTTSGGGDISLVGSVSGAGGITVAGSGTVTLSGANNYTGATTVNAGKLQLSNAAALPATTTLTVNSGAVVDLNGQNIAITNFGLGSSSGLITNGAGGTGTITVSDWTNGLNTVVADGATGPVALSFLSDGNVTGGSLNNNNNNFSGGLTIGNAVSGSGYARFQLGATPVNTGVPGAITSSPFGRGTITIGNSAKDKAQIWINAGNSTILNNIVANTALGSDRVGSLRVDVAGTVFAGTLTANLAPLTLSCNSSGNTVSLTGQITGPNGFWLRFNPSDTPAYLVVTLSNVTANANNYQGVSEIDIPYVLVLGATNQIPNGVGAGDVTNSGTIKLNGHNQTINGLWGTGTLDGGSGTPTLTLGANNETSTFGGVITNSSGSLALTKIGSGSLTLSGSNTYSGATTINAGLLQGALGGSCSNSAVTVAATTGNTAVLGVPVTDVSHQWTCASLTINNSGTSSGLQFDFGLLTPGTSIAPLNVTGGVNFSTPPDITVSGNNLPPTTGNGYPLLTWGSGVAPNLTGATLTFIPAIISGNLLISGNTLYLQCSNLSTNNITLTVTNGSGSGNYANDSQVTITAADDPPGMVFSSWVVDSGNPVIANSNAPTTTLTMPTNSFASVTAIFTNIPVPPPIAGLGYSLAWNDEFDGGLKSIDLNNTQTNGYKWYVQAPFSPPVPASYFTNPEPSVLRILGAAQGDGGEQLVSSVAMNTGFNLADSAGFYVEGRIRILTTSYVYANSWPAFWLRGSEGAFSATATPWPGTTNGWQNSVELDLMEYYGGTSYGSAMHDWYGFGPYTDNNTHTLWSANSYGGYPTNVWHTYGCLMVPSWQTSNGMGYAKMFLDNAFVSGFSETWQNPTNLYTTDPNSTNTPAGSNLFSTAELWHHIVSLGTASSGSPIDVDWVRVWQPVTMTGIGGQTNGFGFYIGDYHTNSVVEACTNLANPLWQPLETNSINSFMTNSNPLTRNPLGANPIYFSDSQWTNYPGRFYRLYWP